MRPLTRQPVGLRSWLLVAMALCALEAGAMGKGKGKAPVKAAVKARATTTAKATVKAGKKGKKRKLTLQEQVTVVLDERDGAVRVCVLDNAITQGATAEVNALLTINSDGQVFGCKVEVTSQLGKDEVRGCVEQVLMKAAFPRLGQPMIQTQRTWRYAYGN